jgi:two-component system chemotaxis response regulator CheY
MKILIVEDDASLQELMQLYLADFGTCDIAGDGVNALEIVNKAIEDQQPYDLICMDIMMPRMDGMEAMKKIRQIEFKHFDQGFPSAKIIMITAKDMAKDMLNAYHAGCEAYLTKPFSREKLLDQLRKLGLIKTPDDPHEPTWNQRAKL